MEKGEGTVRLTVLVDNNTYINQYLLGEPALSYYIEDEEEKILLDAGYSDIFLSNAEKLQIDVSAIGTIVLSHGHSDHTGGLPFLFKQSGLDEVKLVAHPDMFGAKQAHHDQIGCPMTRKELDRKFDLILSKQPVILSEHLLFLGEIPRYFDFEPRYAIGMAEKNDVWQEDLLLDDSAVAAILEEGLFIITSCSHSGICSIIEHAKKVTGINKIAGVIGGFHLFEESERLVKTIQYFKENRIQRLYPCHCTSFAVKAVIHKEIPIQEVGVGLTIEL